MGGRLSEPDTTVKEYVISLCQACIDGIPSECHTPGCALWLHRVDLPIHRDLLTEVEPIWEGFFGEERLTGYKVKRC
jgi:hypothetical protein